jgi:NitT/TauT family transport system substrate-binding protein
MEQQVRAIGTLAPNMPYLLLNHAVKGGITMSRFAAAALLIGVLAIWPGAGAGAAPALPVVNVGQTFVNAVPTGFWVARERGLFRKYGLDVRIVLFRGDTQGTQALIAGGIPVMMGGPAGALAAAASGVDLVETLTLSPAMPYLLVGRGAVKTPQDLRGRRIGVSGTGLSASRVAVLIALRSFGLDPQKDGIVLLPMGTEAERTSALEQGSIDATVFDLLYKPIIDKQGLPIIANLAERHVPWEHDVLLTTRRYAQSHRQVMESLIKGLLEAHAYILDPANKRFVLRIMAENLGKELVADAEGSYNEVTQLWIKKKPYPNMAGLQAIFEIVKQGSPQAASYDLKSFVDDSILRSLDQSGWIDALYARK